MHSQQNSASLVFEESKSHPLQVLLTDMDTLPEIPLQKQSLTGKQSARSPPSICCFEDSGLQLDLRESLASGSRHSASAGGTIRSQSPVGPRPPPASLRPSTVSPRPMQSNMRKSLESVRVSRSELTRKEQLINSLRSDNLQLEQKVRELEHSRENSILLQSVCSKVAQCLDCNVEGVAAESIHDILRTKITKLTQDYRQATRDIDTCRDDLERSRGEQAATKVKCSNLKAELTQHKSALERKESDVKQLKCEMESLQQTCARTGATVQSLRQQLEHAKENNTTSLNDQLTQLQTELGRMRNEQLVKNDQIESQKSQLSVKQADLESLQERVTTSDTMYADLCAQLVMALQVESTDSFDTDQLISQVSGLCEECSELRMRMDTVTKSMKTVELDSKASRETILRLVAESKQHENQATIISDLQQRIEEMTVAMETLDKDKEGLEERLMAAKETMLAQEKEMQAKESKIDALSHSVFSLQRNSDSERSLTDSAEQKYYELCESLAVVLGSQTKDTSLLLTSVEQLVKNTASRDDELSQQSSHISQMEESTRKLSEELARTREVLKHESSKVKQLEGERMTGVLFKDGLTKELEKHKAFTKRLTRAVNLDSGTAEILSGDFAHDAILTKAEQMAKQETQLLAERQTAIYTLQRKLKNCRHSLDSKELHLGLLQKKVTVLEERLLKCSQKEGEWGSSIDKMRKMEKQVERLQSRATHQKDTINQLKEENADVHRLKSQCATLEDRVSQLLTSLEEVSQARVQQAQRLAEARLQKQVTTPQTAPNHSDKEEREKLLAELCTVRQEMELAKQKETELCAFKVAVKRLLKDQDDEETPDDYSLIAKLESLLALQQKSKETSKCLEASLRQLESGFKTSYNDALTLLSTESATVM